MVNISENSIKYLNNLKLKDCCYFKMDVVFSKMSMKIITLLAHCITFSLACISNAMECHYIDSGCYTFVGTLNRSLSQVMAFIILLVTLRRN